MQIKILYGLSPDLQEKLNKGIFKTLEDNGYNVSSVSRYRKEGVFQYAAQMNAGINIVIEENLQISGPYDEVELLQLSDCSVGNIIFILDRKHYGTQYIKYAYACGFTSLFSDEATSEMISHLLLQGRNNKKEREYCGIITERDAETIWGIINPDILNAYMEYIEDGINDDIDGKYRFIASRLSPAGNRAFASGIPTIIKRQLRSNEIYQFYSKDGKKRRELNFSIPWRKKSDNGEEIVEENRVSDYSHLHKDTNAEEEDMINLLLNGFSGYHTEEAGIQEQIDTQDNGYLLQNFKNYLDELENIS